MKNTCRILLSLFLATGSPTLWSADPDTSTPAGHEDSLQYDRDNYPRRLISEFPVIYADTAIVTPRYSIVVRAVWTTRRDRKCKVTSPDQLPEPHGACMIRFVHRPAYDTARFQTEDTVIQRK